MTRVAVFGAGSWGTAFSMVLADAGHDVTIWGRREDLCTAINATHQNPDYLPGIELPTTVWATSDPARAAADASLVVLAARSETRDILTLDERHFRAVVDARGRPFRLLPADA